MSSEIFEELFKENKITEATIYCEKWLKEEPESGIALNSMALCMMKQGNTEKALELFKRAVELYPKIAAYHNNLSNAYLALGKVDEAKQHLNQSLDLFPHPESFNNLGRWYYKQGLYQEAIDYFLKALRMNPNYFEAHYNLGH